MAIIDFVALFSKTHHYLVEVPFSSLKLLISRINIINNFNGQACRQSAYQYYPFN
jgi:hypothetical protein